MFIVYALRWSLLVMEVLIAVPVLYLCAISVSAILTDKRRRAKTASLSSTAGDPGFTFAILIPAHNEEAILANLLESLANLVYPKDQYSVYVVADNCTDATARIAREMGWVNVYERFDEVKRGKGCALEWLLGVLEEEHFIYDAYVFLDADSVVVPTFLQSMAMELTQGAQAMQACNTVLNGSDSPSTALRLIALTLMNHVRPLGRNGLGASSTLTGNGMCLSRSLLMRSPWQAYPFLEDYQYYLRLVEHGERVRYVPEAVVRSEMPTTFAQMRTQDILWEPLAPSWRIALRLLGAGLRSRDFARIEPVAELLTPPLSIITCCCLLTFIATLLLWWLPGLLLSLMLIGGVMLYVGTGLYLLHPPRVVYMALLHAPGFIIWKLWVYLVLRRSKKVTARQPWGLAERGQIQ